MSCQGVTLTPEEIALVRAAYLADRRGYLARACVVAATAHRALAALPVLRMVRVALLRAAEQSANPSTPPRAA